MKKVLLGAIIGAAVGGVACMLKEEKRELMARNMNRYSTKTKRNFMNALDMGKNQMGYLRDKVGYEIYKMKKHRI